MLQAFICLVSFLKFSFFFFAVVVSYDRQPERLETTDFVVTNKRV